MPSGDEAQAGLVAVYPGSFDPITNGHLEIIERASRLFDRVVVAIGQHATKRGTFSVDERKALIRTCASALPNIEVAHFEGLVVDFCRTAGARVIVRGLRAVGDFEAEFRMGLANRDMAPEIETVFLIPRPEVQFISSSLVKEIAGHGGDYRRLVPQAVADALRDRVEPKP
jgi:pantetheine-phosphate adenylyltransferase